MMNSLRFQADLSIFSPSEVISLVQLNFVGPGISPPRRLARDFRSMRLVQQRAGPEIEPAPGSRKSFDLVVGKFLVLEVQKLFSPFVTAFFKSLFNIVLHFCGQKAELGHAHQ